MLEQVDLDQKLSKAEYKQVMPKLRKRLFALQQEINQTKFPVVIVFEGWDASGKGKAIKKFTDYLDPRRFKLHPIRPARTYEQKRPWLWRFWRKLPNYGEFGIFDTSWYRRVLVERVEEEVSEVVWQQAYQDIVNFEQILIDDGTIIIKFWLHLSEAVQEARFKRLESDILTAWRVTSEDWVHHGHYAQYFVAVEEMLEKTSLEWAPWTIIEAHDHRHTNVKIFQTVIDTLEQKLGT